MPFSLSACAGKRTSAPTLIVALTLLLAATAQAQVTFSKQTYPTGLNPQSVFSEDFSGDGRWDLAIALYDESKLELRYGQADGTFSAGIQVPLCGFPKEVLGARLNSDNIVDLVVLTDASASVPQSCGGFAGNPLVEFVLSTSGGGTPAVAHFTLPKQAIDMAVGDLNGDGVFDVAALASDETVMTILLDRAHPEASVQNSTLADVSAPVARSLALADFNADGKADLVMSACCTNGNNAEGGIFIKSGRGDGTFSLSATTLDTHPANALLRADLNKDGKPDLVAALQDCPPKAGCNSGVAAYLNQGASFLKIPVWNSSSSSNAYIDPRSPAVGLFTDDGPLAASNHDDIAFLVTDQRFETGGDFLFVVPMFPNNTVASPVKYFLGFDQGTQAMAWTKIAGSSSLADLAGVNAVPNTFDALTNTTDKTGGVQCSPPDAVGVNICRPFSGASVGSSFRLLAAASVLDRTYRLEVWEGATKLATARDTYLLDAPLTLSRGSHTLTFVARNAANSSRASKSVTFTVGAGSCSVPATNSINVCSPVDGSTVSNPVPLKAAARVTGSVYRLELWIDGVKADSATVRNSNVMDTSITLPAGLHRFEFVAYNLDRTSRVTKTVRATVK